MSIIRAMRESDKPCVMDMMREFYASPAVFSNGSDEIFASDIENCINNNPYIEGYVIEQDDNVQGYAMIAKSYSTEFGKTCIWIEDLYVKNGYRGLGLGKQLLQFIITAYTDCIFRLEVEEDNQRAVRLYEASGFTVLPYMEMKL